MRYSVLRLSSVIGVLVCAIGFLVYPLGGGEAHQNPQEWLQERYKEASSVRVGMSRADLRELFDEDGGLQRLPASRYLLKNCRMIKVDVEFDTEYGQAYKTQPDEELKIKVISKPYLEYMFID
jgi:hypothetical protein